MIQGFHSNWTKPFFTLNQNKEYFIEDFEILTTILSALKWREFNGSIKMITDINGAEYYKKLGIEKLWDGGIFTYLEDIPKSINPNIFWAAGKIYAMNNEKIPFAMIDTDFIVWSNIEPLLKDKELCTIHKEDLSFVYPGKESFIMKENYNFDKEWDWKERPCNTAFTYIANEKFKNYYTKSSIEFMKNLKFGNDRIINMVFAEQRLISMCSKKMNIKSEELISLNDLFKNKQKLFTHIWGYKDIMKKDSEKRKEFCIRCINRIIKDYPDFKDTLINIKELEKYFS